MTANIPGSFPTAQGGRGIVPPARVQTFIEQGKTGDMSGVGVQDKAGGFVEAKKNPNNNEDRDQVIGKELSLLASCFRLPQITSIPQNRTFRARIRHRPFCAKADFASLRYFQYR